MPWLHETPPSDAIAAEWHLFFKNCLLRRIQPDQIARPMRELARIGNAHPACIASVFMGFRDSNGRGRDDPLVFNYAEVLLRNNIVGTGELLSALFETSKFAKTLSPDVHGKLHQGLPNLEERLFALLTQMHIAGDLPVGLFNAHMLIRSLALWMHAATQFVVSRQLEVGGLYTLDIFSFGTYEALAALATTVLGNRALRELYRLPWWQKRRGTVVREMENFDTHVLQWMQSQLAGPLRELVNLPPYLELDSSGRPLFTDDQILQSIHDLPVVNSRAGLYIWLNACLCARPLTDDLAMLTYLQTRYAGDFQSVAVGLLHASFDVLTNTLLRKQSDHDIKVIRSFICNKVPLLLGILGGFMAPSATAEACVQAAFESIAVDVLPPISAGSAEVRQCLRKTQAQFLSACVLHGVVSEATVAVVSMEPTTSSPKPVKYSKDGLVVQCSHNLARLEPLVDELDAMTGNAGAIAGCIVDVLNGLCANKDTMSLKNVCHMLVKRIHLMDIVLQHTQPANLLLSLCTLLNDWMHDSDQTEFTPAYEEFASILLFLLCVVYRYGLERSQLGLIADDNFVARLLREKAVSRRPGDLTPEQLRQLRRWIEGLYATDDSGETSGISDDVMRQCTPQAFYQLVPTLFEQSCQSCKAGGMPPKAFKGGLELLVEPFLLPSLIGGIAWVIEHFWRDHGDTEVLLMALDKLLRPSSSSPEAKAMHRAVLGVMASPLSHSLEALVARKTNQKQERQINSLLEILRPHRDRRRTMDISTSELAERAPSAGNGIPLQLRATVADHVAWVSGVGPAPPPRYTHRAFAADCDSLGVNGVLDALVAELKAQTSLGYGPLALDICASIVCAPLPTTTAPLDPTPHVHDTPPLTVQHALHLRTASPQHLLRAPVGEAEALVRLARRVDAQLAGAHSLPQLPPLAVALPIPSAAAAAAEAVVAADHLMAELGLAGDTGDQKSVAAGMAAAAVSVPTGAELGALVAAPLLPADLPADADDLFGDLENMDMDPPPGQSVDLGGELASQQQSAAAEDDIFAGLDLLGEEFNFN